MATLQEVTTSLDDLKAAVATVDQGVEALYEQIKQFQGQGITPEVADQLLAKVQEVRSALDVVSTDD